MPHWSMFSKEVVEEKHIISAYGGARKVNDRCRCGDSYKAQALRELSKALLLQEEIKALEARLAAAIDLLDDVKPSEMESITGIDRAKCQQLLRKICLAYAPER